MQSYNSKFVIILVTFTLILSNAIFAQGNNKIVPPTEMKYSGSSSTNDLKSLTNVQPKETQLSAEKTALLKELENARTTNNITKKEQIEAQLNKMNNHQTVRLIENPNVVGVSVADKNKQSGSNTDYLVSPINTVNGIWSSATQTAPAGFPNAGTIYVAATIYNAAGGDTCRIYSSVNGGQSWTSPFYFYFTGNADFRANELDIELLYDGSAVWIYGVAGYSDITNNRTYSLVFRFNTTTSAFAGYTLLWPGNATTTNLYYDPRIVSDNSNYTSASYVMITCSFDSTYSGTLHYNRQKYSHITNPFAASPTIDYTQTSINNGGFYWNSSGVPGGTYLWTDIAYFRTSASSNRIFTVYNVPGSSNYNLYLAWSDDYGATVAGSSSIAESNVDYGARVVFNGGTTNYNGMIAYVRQYSGTDWDPYYRSTTDGGTTWTAGYIDGSSNRTRSVDIVAPRGANNQFKVAYDQDSASGNFAFYTGGNGTSWSSPSQLAISPNGADSTFSKCIAGFKNGGGDDCFALYSMGSGTGLYSSRACQTTVGVGNNNGNIPQVYSLSQNFPNPFNPTTNIKFSLPQQSFVKLVVYDILGNEVATLINGNMEAGNHEIDFNATSLASGIYLYKIEAGEFTAVKKMMLIK